VRSLLRDLEAVGRRSASDIGDVFEDRYVLRLRDLGVQTVYGWITRVAGRAGAAISLLSAGSADLARGAARVAPAPSQARLIERVAAPNEHADVAVRGHSEAAIRKELPCPTRL
jgi:hypothetical protein